MWGVAGAVGLGAGLGLVASPYLASLTRTVPDRDNHAWWRVTRPDLLTCAITAVTAAGFGALAGAAAGWSAVLPALLALALVTAPLVAIDVRLHRLPDRLVYLAAGAGLCLLALAAAIRHDGTDLLRAVEAAAAVVALGLLAVLVAPHGLGLGDVKLAAVLGGYLGWYGWRLVYEGILVGFLIGVASALGLLLARRITRRAPFAFGPCLLLGAFLVLAFRS